MKKSKAHRLFEVEIAQQHTRRIHILAQNSSQAASLALLGYGNHVASNTGIQRVTVARRPSGKTGR